MVHIQRDTGEITASCRELAEDAATTLDEAARALDRLAAIGALLKRERGRYAINPHVGWVGDLATRQEAATPLPPGSLADPGVYPHKPPRAPRPGREG